MGFLLVVFVFVVVPAVIAAAGLWVKGVASGKPMAT